VQKMLCLILEDYDHATFDIHLAENGREALAQLQAHPDTDLVLLDVNMPEMGGIEFLKTVRAEPVFRDLPIVIQSTEAQPADISLAMDAGANAYLAKPFTAEQVHTTLDRLLPGIRPADEGSPDPLARKNVS